MKLGVSDVCVERNVKSWNGGIMHFSAVDERRTEYAWDLGYLACILGVYSSYSIEYHVSERRYLDTMDAVFHLKPGLAGRCSVSILSRN